MGLAQSYANNKFENLRLSTFDELDFQNEMDSQLEAARSAGRQEALSQAVRSGGFGGGMYGASALSGTMLTQGQQWVRINEAVSYFSFPMLVCFGIMLFVSLFVENQALRLISAFIFFFFFISKLYFLTARGERYVFRPSGIGYGLLGGVITATTLTFSFDKIEV